MKRKISWKTIGMMLMFGVSSIMLFVIAFSNMCLTWTGSVALIVLITLASYSFIYLSDRYDRLFK